MKKFIGPILLVSIILIVVLATYYSLNPLTPKLKINNQIITYEIAITDAQRQRGLSGRDRLPDNHGMLFVYPSSGRYGFWMKDMKFSLDFIWINNDTVVDLHQAVPFPENGERPITIESNQSVNRILEVNAGTVAKADIKIGDKVQFLRR